MNKEEPRYRQMVEAPMYEVCDHGYIRRINTGKTIKPYLNKKENGYVYVKLQVSGQQKAFHVGVVVGTYFVDNPDNKPTINHNDGNKLNNHYLNLKWATYKENSEHAFRTGLGKSGLKHYSSKFSMEDIIEIKELASKSVKRFEIARIYNVSETAIDNLIKGRTYKNISPYSLDLTRPRFKISEPYPFSPYQIGDIITTGENSQLFRMFIKFPKVFTRLQWWEERKPEDMPEYVKEESGPIHKVKYYEQYNSLWMEAFDGTTKSTWCVNERTMPFFEPSSEAEYLNYLTQQNKIA